MCRKRLKDDGEEPDSEGCYSTLQLTRVIYGNLHSEQLRRIKEQADRFQLENEITQGRYLDKAELMAGLSQLVQAILDVIKNSKLTREEQNNIRHNLVGFSYVLEDVGQRQTDWRESDRNGQEDQKPKRALKKAKKAVSGLGDLG